MGNDCKVCQKNNAEQELIIGGNRIMKKNPDNSLDHVKSEQKFLTFKEIVNHNPEQYKKLHKIKNSILSFQKRKMFKNMLKKFREEQKIFTYEEYIETLSSNKKYSSFEKKSKEEYKYKSGAVYVGDWFGGFRHGYGVMTWEDGIVYLRRRILRYPGRYGEGLGELPEVQRSQILYHQQDR